VDAHQPRVSLVHTLGYEILIHINQIVDYRLPLDSSTDWSESLSFHWCLGYRNDWRHEPSRHPIQDRLGMRKRDRSPPGGADGGTSDSPSGTLLPRSGGSQGEGCRWFVLRGGGMTAVAPGVRIVVGT
jgi:hypothetical protein